MKDDNLEFYKKEERNSKKKGIQQIKEDIQSYLAVLQSLQTVKSEGSKYRSHVYSLSRGKKPLISHQAIKARKIEIRNYSWTDANIQL